MSGGKARRRSQRLTLRVPLIAYSYSETTGRMRFRETTHTVKVTANGGLIPLRASVGHGDLFQLKHPARDQEHGCKVVYLGVDSKSGKSMVGFEFAPPEPDFWHIYFPPMNGKAIAAGASDIGNGNGSASYYARG